MHIFVISRRVILPIVFLLEIAYSAAIVKSQKHGTCAIQRHVRHSNTIGYRTIGREKNLKKTNI